MPQDTLIPPTTLVAGYTRIPARYHTLTLTMPVVPRAKRNPRIQARDGDTKTPERSGFKLKLKNPDFKRHTVAIPENERLRLLAEIANRILFWFLKDTSDHPSIKIDGTSKAAGSGDAYKKHFKILSFSRAWRKTNAIEIHYYLPERLLRVPANIGFRPPNISRASYALLKVPDILRESIVEISLFCTRDLSIYSVTESAYNFISKRKTTYNTQKLSIFIQDGEKMRCSKDLRGLGREDPKLRQALLLNRQQYAR
ncbi:unnamed protein product [Cercospora beticola]|nr:unnamed protein product [Cercospora beticola]